MILKTLTHDRGSGDCWNFYDKIESASVFYDESAKMSCISIKIENAESEICIGLNDVAYLCNDVGQTIEKLRPAVSRQNYGNKTLEHK